MTKTSLTDRFVLANGVGIPCLGFGTWKIPDGEETIQAVSTALKAGYRHIDTAAAYRNEAGVGQAVRDSGIAREEIFVVSKLRNPDHGYANAAVAFDKTMANLGLDYLDMYMLHWPIAKGHKDHWQQDIVETWRFFEERYRDGTVKALGVCNFLPHHLTPLLAEAKERPLVDQIEIHPSFLQQDAVDFCRKEGIQVEAWGPLANGKLFESVQLRALAAKYDRSVAQLTLRWLLQKDILPLPKSTTPERIAANAAVFDFVISEADMRAIDAVDDCGNSGLFPDTIDF